MENTSSIKRKDLMKFVIPSILGLMLFIVPIPHNGNFSIGVGMMASGVKSAIGDYLPAFMTYVIIFSAVASFVGTVVKPKFITENKFLNETFVCKPLWLGFRVLGGVFAFMTLNQLGNGMISSGATGGTVLFDLMPTLATWFFFSCFFLPFLMQYGLMDFIGTVIRKVMRPLFLVPGRSAIDATASWIGSGPVGIVITDQQYKSGFYTAKEASIIATCFSLVSLPFAVVVAEFLNISHMFLQFYGTICIASIVCALILPRIYPLAKIKDDYHPAVGKQISEEVPEGYTVFQWAVEKGVERSKTAGNVGELATEGMKTVFDIYMGLMPLVMCWGTLALIIEQYTPIFSILAIPFVFILEILRVPGAEVAAPAIVVGFADMFLPAILVSGVEFEITRFIIGALSFTQLIYMTETGAVILRSEIPLRVRDLFIIFLQRTLITLPVVVLLANIFFR